MSVVKRQSSGMAFKVIVIGNSGVGKTSLLYRFTDGQFPDSHMSTIGKLILALTSPFYLPEDTIGIDFRVKTVVVGDNLVNLKMWDTAGQERYRTLTQTYYKGADAILLMYDCTDKNAFANISMWMKQINMYASKDALKIIVSSKNDIKNKKISSAKGEALADKYDCPFFATSAKSGENVDELFMYAAETLAKNKENKEKPNVTLICDESTYSVSPTRNKKTRLCKWLLF